jgi:hypothetical protein
MSQLLRLDAASKATEFTAELCLGASSQVGNAGTTTVLGIIPRMASPDVREAGSRRAGFVESGMNEVLERVSLRYEC